MGEKYHLGVPRALLNSFKDLLVSYCPERLKCRDIDLASADSFPR